MSYENLEILSYFLYGASISFGIVSIILATLYSNEMKGSKGYIYIDHKGRDSRNRAPLLVALFIGTTVISFVLPLIAKVIDNKLSNMSDEKIASRTVKDMSEAFGKYGLKAEKKYDSSQKRFVYEITTTKKELKDAK